MIIILVNTYTFSAKKSLMRSAPLGRVFYSSKNNVLLENWSLKAYQKTDSIIDNHCFPHFHVFLSASIVLGNLHFCTHIVMNAMISS